MKPLWVSKFNTVAQILFASLVLASLGFEFTVEPLRIALMAAVAVLTLLSVAFYVAEWMRHMNSAAAGR
jgi:cardiolipin synthase